MRLASDSSSSREKRPKPRRLDKTATVESDAHRRTPVVVYSRPSPVPHFCRSQPVRMASRWSQSKVRPGCASSFRGRAGNQSQERIRGVPTKAPAGRRDRVADDGNRRQVRRSQTHGLGLADIGNLSRLKAHDRGSHGIDRNGISARDDRAQRERVGRAWVLRPPWRRSRRSD